MQAFVYQGKKWWAWKELNLRPIDYESTALTAELQALNAKNFTSIAFQIPLYT